MLKHTFTSTGAKFFAHQSVMENLRDGKGQPIVTHVMLTDICNHKCAFCSVQHRAGESLPFDLVTDYIDTLIGYGLKAVILSGGGNPILYKRDGKNFNSVVDMLYSRGLEIGLITNGMPLIESLRGYTDTKRLTWKGVTPETLDKLTWVRVSLAGLDHTEREAWIPDTDPKKTALGFSYVAHDIYNAPEDKAHGKVSTEKDVLQLGSLQGRAVWRFEDRIEELQNALTSYCLIHQPRYLRLLPNCLEPELIPERCEQLQTMADAINKANEYDVAFVQYKPPAAPKACYLGYIHPVLNCDGYVYPCDSCVLNESAGHKFANPWRICHASEIGKIYNEEVKSLIDDPAQQCPGCVFTESNRILGTVVDGTADLTPLEVLPEHHNFV